MSQLRQDEINFMRIYNEHTQRANAVRIRVVCGINQKQIFQLAREDAYIRIFKYVYNIRSLIHSRHEIAF